MFEWTGFSSTLKPASFFLFLKKILNGIFTSELLGCFTLLFPS